MTDLNGKYEPRIIYLRDKTQPKGGVTIAVIDCGEGFYIGSAALCSYSDNFCKRTGRRVALGRLNTFGPKDIEAARIETSERIVPVSVQVNKHSNVMTRVRCVYGHSSSLYSFVRRCALTIANAGSLEVMREGNVDIIEAALANPSMIYALNPPDKAAAQECED